MKSKLDWVLRFQTTIILLLFLSYSIKGLSQVILPENLTKKVKIYWDANNKFIHSTGCYYQDEHIHETTEKHGKWSFYTINGVLEEDRIFYRNRMHGKQTIYYPNKKPKQVYYCKFNVADSLFKEFNEAGTLVIQGNYLLGSPEGQWQYFYEDSTRFKIEKTANDTTYLLNYWEADAKHTQTITEGNGYVKTYFSTGRIKESYTFKNGLRNGSFIENLASGKPSISGEFLDGKKDGDWTFYFPDGSIEKSTHYRNDSLDGEYHVFYENGKYQTKGQYVNGAKTGEWSWYINNGDQLDMKGSFINNMQDGDWEYFYSSGELSYKAQYAKNQKSGEWSYFYKGGQPYRKGVFNEDEKSGLWQTWYEDGTVLMEGNYSTGKEEGLWKNYWENGKLKNQSFFKDGELNGAWHSYTLEGNLVLFGRYKNNLKCSKWTEFYNNGSKKEEVNYKIKKIKNNSNDVVAIGLREIKSVEHGKFIAYSHIDFSKKEIGKFKNGKKHGKWTNYHPGGVVPAVTAYYKKGELDGTFSQYDRRGNKMNEIHYKEGKKHGWFIVYGRDGRPISQKMFHNGHEMRRINGEDGFSPH